MVAGTALVIVDQLGLRMRSYPTMLAPLLILLTSSFFIIKAKTDRVLLSRYVMACGGTIAVGILALNITFGRSRLIDMVLFTNAFNSVSRGVVRKAHFAASIFASHPLYAILLAFAVIVTVARGSSMLGRSRQWITGLATAALIIGVMTTDSPTLFVRSHDLVLMLSVAGLGEAFQALSNSDADRGTRAFGLIYLVSTAAGITTMITAFNGPYNFPIGGLLAACLALIPFATTASNGLLQSGWRPHEISTRTPTLILGAVACCAFGWSTFTFYYGQVGTPFHNMTLVREGAFKGLRTDGEQASFISELTEVLNSQRSCGTQMAVLARSQDFI